VTIRLGGRNTPDAVPSVFLSVCPVSSGILKDYDAREDWVWKCLEKIQHTKVTITTGRQLLFLLSYSTGRTVEGHSWSRRQNGDMSVDGAGCVIHGSPQWSACCTLALAHLEVARSNNY